MMINFNLNKNDRFHMRAAAILLNKGRVLLQRPADQDIWFLPGGRVEFFESTESALKREMIEEFDIEIDKVDLCWVVENLVEMNGSKIHEIAIHYLVELSAGHEILDYENEFWAVEPGYMHKWIKIDDLQQYNIVPEFVVPRLQKFQESEGIIHVVSESKR